MAIEFDCPHCGFHYRLKDELAGKAASCKNCREKIRIPTVSDDTPLPDPPVDAEAAAAAALSDEPKPEQVAKTIIDVECNFCGHKWTEPIARAGKNTLCPNPDCKQRIRIPEPKDEGQYDWRHKKSKMPEGAKRNEEKLEGVVDVADTKYVSGETLKKTGVLDEELEPRPLKQKVMFALIGVGLLAGLVFGTLYLLRSGKENREDRTMQQAVEEFNKSTETYQKEEVALFAAVLHIAAGEHALRHDTKEKLKEAMDEFAKAQMALRPLSSPARNALVAELAVTMVALGGTEGQARDQIRIRWEPALNVRTRPNEQLFTVHEELRKVLGLVQTADFEFRRQLARRLTRELIKRGQPNLAAELLPLALFNQTNERAEAKAVVALEIWRTDKASSQPVAVAKELAGLGKDIPKSAASAQTLFNFVKVEKAPNVVAPPPPGNGNVSDFSRYAYTGIAILDGKPNDALALAQRPGKPEEQLRALLLCADWSTDPGPALDAAYGLLAANKNRKDVTFPAASIMRLAEIAATLGKAPQVRQFAEFLPDDSAKAWGLGNSLRLLLVGNPTSRGEESMLEIPDDLKKLRAGHAWGRLWIARQNARISGDRSAELKVVNAWPTPLVPFGKAGIALGLQDRDK